MAMDRRFLLLALLFAVAGLLFGIYMASTHDLVQKVTHVHILTVGFLLSFSYAVIYRLWLPQATGRLVCLHFYCHAAGALLMAVGLFLLFGERLPESTLGPLLGLSSMAVLAGMLMMAWQVVCSCRQPAG